MLKHLLYRTYTPSLLFSRTFSSTLFVKGISFSSTEETLTKAFSQYGQVLFSELVQRHVDKEQVKAAIKAQQEHQIDNALLAEGRYYSDLELTEKEIERSVMDASRAEYLMESSKPRLGPKESSTSNAETSSSGARS